MVVVAMFEWVDCHTYVKFLFLAVSLQNFGFVHYVRDHEFPSGGQDFFSAIAIAFVVVHFISI